MEQSRIIITHTIVDYTKLSRLVAHSFNNASMQLNTMHKHLSEEKWAEMSVEFSHLVSEGLVLTPSYEQKEDLRKDMLDLYQQYNQPTLLFLGDLNSFSIPAQESMLKLIEEPPHNLYIVLFAQSKSQILPTIASRCRIELLLEALLLQIIPQTLKETVKKKFPDPVQVAKSLLQQNVQSRFDELFTDVSKYEREEIDFWLWQLEYCLKEYYKLKPEQIIAEKIVSVLRSKQLNNSNLQKKFALKQLQV